MRRRFKQPLLADGTQPPRAKPAGNKPQGGGIPPWEGLSADVRTTMGAQMVACIEMYADAEGISISAWVRNACRRELAQLGTVFTNPHKPVEEPQ